VYSAAGTACIHIIEGVVGKGKEICWWTCWTGRREGGEVEMKTGKKYISSPRLNIICEIEARFFEKVLNRVRDNELNTFDLYQDIEALSAIHQVHMESLSLVQKVRQQQKC